MKKIVPIHRAHGGPVFEENPTLADLRRAPLRRPRGRPRADAKAARINQLKDEEKKSWRLVTKAVTAEFPGTTADAPRRLYRSRKHADGVHRNHVLEPVFVQLIESMQPRVLRVPKRLGRPRQDEIRFEALRMEQQGMSVEEIRLELNAKYKQSLTLDAYRKKLRSFPMHEGPGRRLALSLIRGK